MKKHRSDKARSIAVLAVVALAVLGWSVTEIISSNIGSITDASRSKDLYIIQGAVDGYFQGHDKVPPRLNGLGIGGLMSRLAGFKGKLTGYAYTPYVGYDGEYDEQAYKLCATFDSDSTADSPAHESDPVNFYNHHKGRNCYDVNAYQDHISAGKYNSSNYQGPK